MVARATRSYDSGNRLTRATNVAGKTYDYAYDANGNRTSVKTDGVTTQSLIYNSANQITTSGYAYDAAGNQTASPAGSAVYNAAEQTTQVGSTAYTYSGADQTEVLRSGTERFVYGHDDQYGQPWLRSYNNSQSDVYVERDAFGTPLGMRTAANDYTFILDGLGSVVAIVAADDGSVVARYTYDPFGVILSASESGLPQANVVRFAGGIYDPVSQRVKFGKRWYDPSLGRFTQQDSLNLIGDPSHGNRYAYAGCDPVNTIDPTGQFGPAWLGCALSATGFFLAIGGLVAVSVFTGGTGAFLFALAGYVVSGAGVLTSCYDENGDPSM